MWQVYWMSCTSRETRICSGPKRKSRFSSFVCGKGQRSQIKIESGSQRRWFDAHVFSYFRDSSWLSWHFATIFSFQNLLQKKMQKSCICCSWCEGMVVSTATSPQLSFIIIRSKLWIHSDHTINQLLDEFTFGIIVPLRASFLTLLDMFLQFSNTFKSSSEFLFTWISGSWA